MKAISLIQPWANLVAEGKKTLKTRKWPTKYRGELLIVSSASPKNPPQAGYALAVVEVVDCRPMEKKDEEEACCDIYPGAWVWELQSIRKIKPFPVKGRLGIYELELPAWRLIGR